MRCRLRAVGRERIRGRNIWTEDWTTNETRQIVARVEVTEMDGEHNFGFEVGWLLADWVFRTKGFGTHDVSSGLDATGSGTGLDGWADGWMDGGLGKRSRGSGFVGGEKQGL